MPVVLILTGTVCLPTSAWLLAQYSSGNRFRTGFALLLASFAVLLGAYWTGNGIAANDGVSHLARIQFVMEIFHNGQWPVWTNRWYTGYPLGLFYGPLFYVVPAVFFLALHIPLLSGMKALMWILHILSGLFMFRFIKKHSGHGGAAAVSSAAYALSWQHSGLILKNGSLPVAVFFIFMPLIYRLLEKAFEQKKLARTAALCGLLLGAGMTLHLQYGTFLALTFTAACLTAAALTDDRSKRRNLITFLEGSACTAFLLSAWVIVPFMREKAFLAGGSQDIIYFFVQPGAVHQGTVWLKDSFLSIVSRTEPANNVTLHYTGLILLILSLLGCLEALKRFRRTDSDCTGTLLTGFIAGFCYLLVQRRYAGFWLFFAAAMAGYGVLYLERLRLFRKFKQAVAPLCVLLLLADFAGMLFPHAEAIPSRETIRRLQTRIETGSLPGRIMTLTSDRMTHWRSVDTLETGASILFGGIHQTATRTYGYASALADRLAVEVLDRTGKPSDVSQKLLRLFNVRFLNVPERDHVWETKNPSPVFFAPRIQTRAADPLLEAIADTARHRYESRKIPFRYLVALVKDMRLDPDNPLADRLFVREPGFTGEKKSESGAYFRIGKFTEEHTRLRLQYSADVPGFVRLAYAFFPDHKAWIDGHPVRILRSVLSETVIAVPEGDHELILQAGISGTRNVLLFLAVVTVFVLIRFLFDRKKFPKVV